MTAEDLYDILDKLKKLDNLLLAVKAIITKPNEGFQDMLVDKDKWNDLVKAYKKTEEV